MVFYSSREYLQVTITVTVTFKGRVSCGQLLQLLSQQRVFNKELRCLQLLLPEDGKR